MKSLGHPCTWKTSCFINGGCNKTVYGHTNGHGDFVLFDALEEPWPIHPCYADRHSAHVGWSQQIDISDVPDEDWTEVERITPDPDGPIRHYELVGTVTNTEKGFVSKEEKFRTQPPDARKEIKKILSGRTSLVTIVDGDGREFMAFADLKKNPVCFRDIVVCRLKAVDLFNKPVFVVTKICRFKHTDDANEE